jgi:hypothetical protein
MRDGDSEPVPSDGAPSEPEASGAETSEPVLSGPLRADGQFRPGDDAVPTHTMEFVRIEGNDALVRYVPGEYVPRGALPAEDPDELGSGSRAGARSGRRRPTPVHALLSVLFWVITVALFITGLNLGIADDYATSRVIAFIAIGTSIVGVLLGGVAVVLNRGRELGITAMVLCVVSNPLVLAELLGWVSNLTK